MVPTSASSAGHLRLLAKNIFDPVEQALVFLIANRRPLEMLLGEHLGELFDQLLLMPVQFLRPGHLHGHQQISASASRDVGHSATANAERRSGLRAGRYREGLSAIERRDLNLAAERQRGEGHRNLAVEIVAVALEERM